MEYGEERKSKKVRTICSEGGNVYVSYEKKKLLEDIFCVISYFDGCDYENKG